MCMDVSYFNESPSSYNSVAKNSLLFIIKYTLVLHNKHIDAHTQMLIFWRQCICQSIVPCSDLTEMHSLCITP